MWNPQAQLMRSPADCPQAPFGWMMCARTAAKELQRAGLIDRKERKAMLRWMREGGGPIPPKIDKVIWAVWMWQMAPATWTVQ